MVLTVVHNFDDPFKIISKHLKYSSEKHIFCKKNWKFFKIIEYKFENIFSALCLWVIKGIIQVFWFIW